MRHSDRKLATDASGGIAVPFAVISVALVALIGSTIDLISLQNQRAALKSVTDSAALATVNELAITSADEARIKFVASAMVHSLLDDPTAKVEPVVDLTENTLSLTVRRPARTNFPGPLAMVETISANATAQLVGEAGNICMIGLSDGVKETVALNHEARLTAEKCAIYSNSTDKSSMYVSHKASLIAEDLIVAGGFKGKHTEAMGELITDAPAAVDPLAARPAPTFGDKSEDCDHTDLVVTDHQALSSGTYCGGLTVDGGTADLFSGTYIIKDGPLTVTGGGTLKGEYTGFYLTGDNAKINFEAASSISLSAPKDGAMTGLLFYADPANPTAGTLKDGKKLKDGHAITSDDARRLVGTIYLPDDKLIIDGNEIVADKSEYTVIVAKAFQLNNGPNLVIKTDYALSDIPVPDGVGPMKDARSLLID